MDIDKSLNQAPLGMSPMMTEMDEGPDIEIEIEDPESVNIDIDGMEIEIDPSEDEGDFNDNLAEDMDEGVLTELAGDLLGEFDDSQPKGRCVRRLSVKRPQRRRTPLHASKKT